jgi:hypothetical protein
VVELLRVRVGYTTADLEAEIMREMEEVERIASARGENPRGQRVTAR